MQDAPYLLTVLLCVVQEFGHLLALALELLLGPLALLLLLCDPLVELQVLPLERPRRDDLLVILSIDLLLLAFLVVLDRLFTNFQHLRVVFRIQVLRSELARAHELAEGVPLEDRSTCGHLRVPASLGPVGVGQIERALTFSIAGHIQVLLRCSARFCVGVMRLHFMQRQLRDGLLDSLTLTSGISRSQV